MVTDSPRDCVVSAAYNVGPDYVGSFVRSLRRYNQSARIILLVARPNLLADFAARYGVELRQNLRIERVVPSVRIRSGTQRIRVTEFLSRSNPIVPRLSFLVPESLLRVLVSLMTSRFFHVRQVLKSEPMGQVLVSDCRDVYFQADPFAGDAPMEFAREPNVLGNCKNNDKWVRIPFGQDVLDGIRGRHAFCAGTILGRHGPMLRYVDSFCDLVRSVRSWQCAGLDQGIHNYIVHRVLRPEEYVVSTNDRGRIVTLGGEKNVRCVDGMIVDERGEPFPIVHQYDRLKVPMRQSLKVLRELEAEAGNP